MVIKNSHGFSAKMEESVILICSLLIWYGRYSVILCHKVFIPDMKCVTEIFCIVPSIIYHLVGPDHGLGVL